MRVASFTVVHLFYGVLTKLSMVTSPGEPVAEQMVAV